MYGKDEDGERAGEGIGRFILLFLPCVKFFCMSARGDIQYTFISRYQLPEQE
jgi:hypothetical protein